MRYLVICLSILAMTALMAETTKTIPIMAGTPYATTCYVKQGAEPGPTVFIIGGCHGNETAGYLAARKLKNWQITAGTLYLITDAHVAAIKANQRGYPGNMNAMFPGKANGSPMERLAAQIWALIKQSRADMLVTLHESVGYHSEDPKRFGQTLTHDFVEMNTFFAPAIQAANARISNPKHKFTPYVAPYKTCPTYNAYQRLGMPATSIETCKQMPLEQRIKYQLIMCEAMFDQAGLKYQKQGASAAPRQPAKAAAATPDPKLPRVTDTIPTSLPAPPRATAPAQAAVPPPAAPAQPQPAGFPWLGTTFVVLGLGLGVYGIIRIASTKA
ncbi:MAG: succinylglutamate desuccinylase/aspartoacylase family protein [Armatimonadia bacterium]